MSSPRALTFECLCRRMGGAVMTPRNMHLLAKHHTERLDLLPLYQSTTCTASLLCDKVYDGVVLQQHLTPAGGCEGALPGEILKLCTITLSLVAHVSGCWD